MAAGLPEELMSTDESRPTQLGRFCTNSKNHRSWMFFFMSMPVNGPMSQSTRPVQSHGLPQDAPSGP